MAFYLIGLGLDLESLSLEALEAIEECDKVYLENYTVEFPYNILKLETVIGKKFSPLTRIMVENEGFLEDAKKQDIALLVYGSPLTATTHISLILKCKELGINYKVFHNASIFDAVAESGLQIYKFGKTASMPKWEANHKPDSFRKILLDNMKICAHTLILVDIGLTFPEALEQLKTALRGMTLEKIVVCSQLGTFAKKKFYYNKISGLPLDIHPPFCFVIPSKLHFMEEEALEKFS